LPMTRRSSRRRSLQGKSPRASLTIATPDVLGGVLASFDLLGKALAFALGE
jgi:hypothetical protein